MTDIRVFPGQHVRVLHGDNSCELGVVISQVSDEVASVRSRSGFVMSVPISSLRRAYLVILDLNGVLGCRIPKRQPGVLRNPESPQDDDRAVVISDSSYKFSFLHRPHLHTFLKFIFRYFFVGVWTSALRTNAEPLIESIFGPKHNNGINYCDKILFRKFREDTTPNPTPEKPYGTLKDLAAGVFEPFSQGVVDVMTGAAVRKADFGVNNTIIVDDSPAKCSHPDNSLCPPPFDVVDVAEYIKAVLYGGTNDGAASKATQQGMLYCMETLERVLAADSLEPLWASKCTEKLKSPAPVTSTNTTVSAACVASAVHVDPSHTVTSAEEVAETSYQHQTHTAVVSSATITPLQNQVDYCTNDCYYYDDGDYSDGEAECVIEEDDCVDVVEQTAAAPSAMTMASEPPKPVVLTTSKEGENVATELEGLVKEIEAATSVAAALSCAQSIPMESPNKQSAYHHNKHNDSNSNNNIELIENNKSNNKKRYRRNKKIIIDNNGNNENKDYNDKNKKNNNNKYSSKFDHDTFHQRRINYSDGRASCCAYEAPVEPLSRVRRVLRRPVVPPTPLVQ